MYEYIYGKIVELNPSYVVIDNSNIGYFVNITLHSYSGLNGKEMAMLFIHQVIREDAHSLFGFSTRLERELFRHLISVSGIGPNTARTILSTHNPAEVQHAILHENVSLLKSIKGIGIKTAQKIVIDLRDKISKIEGTVEMVLNKTDIIKEEALSALVMLGFPKNQADKVIDKIISENPDIKVEELVKIALKNL